MEHFAFNNPEFERLEALLDEFNPFVAMRWAQQWVEDLTGRTNDDDDGRISELLQAAEHRWWS